MKLGQSYRSWRLKSAGAYILSIGLDDTRESDRRLLLSPEAWPAHLARLLVDIRYIIGHCMKRINVQRRFMKHPQCHCKPLAMYVRPLCSMPENPAYLRGSSFMPADQPGVCAVFVGGFESLGRDRHVHVRLRPWHYMLPDWC